MRQFKHLRMILSLGLFVAWTTSACAVGSDNQTADSNEKPVFERTGVCGIRGDATVSVDGIDGFEDHYLIGDAGEGNDICRIRYTLSKEGEASVPCEPCEWVMVIKKSNPEVVRNVDDGCVSSELQLDADAIAALDGESLTIGFASEYIGHSSTVMVLNEETGGYEPMGAAHYNEETGEFSYEMLGGFCGY